MSNLLPAATWRLVPKDIEKYVVEYALDLFQKRQPLQLDTQDAVRASGWRLYSDTKHTQRTPGRIANGLAHLHRAITDGVEVIRSFFDSLPRLTDFEVDLNETACDEHGTTLFGYDWDTHERAWLKVGWPDERTAVYTWRILPVYIPDPLDTDAYSRVSPDDNSKWTRATAHMIASLLMPRVAFFAMSVLDCFQFVRQRVVTLTVCPPRCDAQGPTRFACLARGFDNLRHLTWIGVLSDRHPSGVIQALVSRPVCPLVSLTTVPYGRWYRADDDVLFDVHGHVANWANLWDGELKTVHDALEKVDCSRMRDPHYTSANFTHAVYSSPRCLLHPPSDDLLLAASGKYHLSTLGLVLQTDPVVGTAHIENLTRGLLKPSTSVKMCDDASTGSSSSSASRPDVFTSVPRLRDLRLSIVQWFGYTRVAYTAESAVLDEALEKLYVTLSRNTRVTALTVNCIVQHRAHSTNSGNKNCFAKFFEKMLPHTVRAEGLGGGGLVEVVACWPSLNTLFIDRADTRTMDIIAKGLEQRRALPNLTQLFVKIMEGVTRDACERLMEGVRQHKRVCDVVLVTESEDMNGFRRHVDVNAGLPINRSNGGTWQQPKFEAAHKLTRAVSRLGLHKARDSSTTRAAAALAPILAKRGMAIKAVKAMCVYVATVLAARKHPERVFIDSALTLIPLLVAWSECTWPNTRVYRSHAGTEADLTLLMTLNPGSPREYFFIMHHEGTRALPRQDPRVYPSLYEVKLPEHDEDIVEANRQLLSAAPAAAAGRRREGGKRRRRDHAHLVEDDSASSGAAAAAASSSSSASGASRNDDD